MAVTINTSPNSLSSVFQPILFNVSSDKTNAELKIKCRIEYLVDSSWTLLANITVDKNSSGSFDCYIHQALNAAIEINFPQGSHEQVIGDTGSMIEYRVAFIELIYDADGLFSESDSLQSASFHCSNILFQSTETATPSDFIIEAGDGRFLGDRDLNLKVKAFQPVVISYIYDETHVSPLPDLSVSP